MFSCKLFKNEVKFSSTSVLLENSPQFRDNFPKSTWKSVLLHLIFIQCYANIVSNLSTIFFKYLNLSERKFLTIRGACILCIQLGFIKQTINIDNKHQNSLRNCLKSRKYTHCVQSLAFPFLLKCLWVVSIKTNVWAIASYLNLYVDYI